MAILRTNGHFQAHPVPGSPLSGFDTTSQGFGVPRSQHRLETVWQSPIGQNRRPHDCLQADEGSICVSEYPYFIINQYLTLKKYIFYMNKHLDYSCSFN
jgi:hypothetical protein